MTRVFVLVIPITKQIFFFSLTRIPLDPNSTRSGMYQNWLSETLVKQERNVSPIFHPNKKGD
jgi:hypothetical protein